MRQLRHAEQVYVIISQDSSEPSPVREDAPPCHMRAHHLHNSHPNINKPPCRGSTREGWASCCMCQAQRLHRAAGAAILAAECQLLY
jgi:hypothetical protein